MHHRIDRALAPLFAALVIGAGALPAAHAAGDPRQGRLHRLVCIRHGPEHAPRSGDRHRGAERRRRRARRADDRAGLRGHPRGRDRRHQGIRVPQRGGEGRLHRLRIDRRRLPRVVSPHGGVPDPDPRYLDLVHRAHRQGRGGVRDVQDVLHEHRVRLRPRHPVRRLRQGRPRAADGLEVHRDPPGGHRVRGRGAGVHRRDHGGRGGDQGARHDRVRHPDRGLRPHLQQGGRAPARLHVPHLLGQQPGAVVAVRQAPGPAADDRDQRGRARPRLLERHRRGPVAGSPP